VAQSDWTELDDGLNLSALKRGVSSGFTPPAGGGSFTYGMNSLTTALGAFGLFTNQTNFAPTPANKGGIITAAMKRGISSGVINFAPFIFIGLQGSSCNDSGYMLGLSDAEPHHIVLKKGSPISSLADAAPGTSGILARSTATFSADTWVHLRLDMIVNLNGDVILSMKQNDLGSHNVTAPTWVAIPGMPDFVDDSIGVNSGSMPFTSGRMGFACFVKDVGRRMYFDQITAARQA
jgi:hypothetical protein